MINIDTTDRLAKKFDVPLEDVLFIAMNTQGISFECDYNRMRMAFRLDDSKLFAYAKERGEMDYYFALPVIEDSPFVLNKDNWIMLENTVIGQAVGPTEDICDSNYPRRKGTSLNINPNTRTGCHGCVFCYTGYQVPHDRKRLGVEADLEEFFEEWMVRYGFTNLSHLMQVSVVTGCYKCNNTVSGFLLLLRQVLKKYAFTGIIFYLGSQVAARRLEYFLEARKMLEGIFLSTDLRPLVWEDYRSLWFLKFGNETLLGIRTP